MRRRTIESKATEIRNVSMSMRSRMTKIKSKTAWMRRRMTDIRSKTSKSTKKRSNNVEKRNARTTSTAIRSSTTMRMGIKSKVKTKIKHTTTTKLIRTKQEDVQQHDIEEQGCYQKDNQHDKG